MKRLIFVLGILFATFSFVFPQQAIESESPAQASAEDSDVVATIEQLIDDNFEGNKDRIKELAQNLNAEQRAKLYEDCSKSAGGYFALNLFLGLGIGSFAQGDKSSGWRQLGFELGGISLIMSGSSLGSSYLVALGVGFAIGSTILGCVSPWVYSSNRNEALQDVLGLPAESVSFAPIVDPSTETYGLVAKINF